MPDTERDARTTTDDTAVEDAAEVTHASDDASPADRAAEGTGAEDATATPTGESTTDGTADDADDADDGAPASHDTTDDSGTDDSGTDDSGTDDSAIDDEDVDGESDEGQNWPLIAMGAVALVAVAALLVAALAWPGFLTRPGSPEGQGARAAAALSDKNASEVDAVSCRDQQGNATNPLPPQALQMIDSARPAGPVRMVLDTQAEVPVDITISAQGQTQTLPASLVMAVTDHQWCMAGISERQ